MVLLGFAESDETPPCGHLYTDPDSEGMQKLCGFFGFDDDERRRSATFLCTALLANLPRLDNLLALLSAEALTHHEWIGQVALFKWSETGEPPQLDEDVERSMYLLIDRTQALLRVELRKVVPWLQGRLFGRLVWGCTAAVLQLGREVVAGLAARGCGRVDADVLCCLAGDASLAASGVRRTVLSAINTLPMTLMRHLHESVQPFTGQPYANASSATYERNGDAFVAQQFESSRFEASLLLGEECPDSDNADHMLCCAYPESPALRFQMLRYQLFVGSWATHWLHSCCAPETIAKHARVRGIMVPVHALLAAPAVKKEQSYVALARCGSALVLRTASDSSIDPISTFCSTLGGIAYRLNPAALNLAAMLLQPARDSRGLPAWEQTCLLAQVLSLVSGQLRCCRLNGKLLLTHAQMERSETIMQETTQQFIDTRSSKRPKY